MVHPVACRDVANVPPQACGARFRAVALDIEGFHLQCAHMPPRPNCMQFTISARQLVLESSSRVMTAPLEMHTIPLLPTPSQPLAIMHIWHALPPHFCVNRVLNFKLNLIAAQYGLMGASCPCHDQDAALTPRCALCHATPDQQSRPPS